MAAGVFEHRLALAGRYTELLAGAGVERGLIGPREVPRLWERHVLNSAVVTELVPRGATVADVGSGAGLPGLVMAIRRPDLRVTLVEPLQRRATFLQEAVLHLADLGLENVEVVRSRAEDLPREARFDVVTARAVAPLDRLLRWCYPLVAPDGVLLALKGRSAHDEVAAASGTLRALGTGPVDVVEATFPELDPPTTVVRVASGPSRR